jgi:hypothetical protein
MKKWLYSVFTRLNKPLLAERSSEALREIGVLWLVFAILDKLLAEELTIAWTVTHGLAAFAAWTSGIYIEFVNDRREP